MLSMLKGAWARIAGGGASSASRESDRDEAPAAEAEHKGFRIRAVPYRAGSGWQTAGVIDKPAASGAREHRFIRAETHPSREDAAALAIAKGRQIIDEQGDRLLGPE